MLSGLWKWNEAMDARLLARAYRNGEHNKYEWKYPGENVYDQNTVGGEIQQSLWIGERNQVTFGGETRRDSVDADEVQNQFDESTTTVGSYLQDEVHVGELWRLTAGIRNDYNTDYDDEWSPRVGLLCHLDPRAEVFASVNRAYRAPALSDRFVKTEWNGILFEGNPDLKPETLMSYELGVRTRPVDKLSVEITGFAENMKDTFDFVLGSDGVFRNQNVTRSKIAGVESGIRYRFFRELSAFANYTFTDGTYDEFPQDPVVEGNQLAYLAKNRAGAGMCYQRENGFSTQVECRYVDSRYGDAQNLEANKMDDYIVANWHTRIPVAKYTMLTFNVDNLFDESYQDLPGVDGPGITFLGGVELTF
jgi:outer membrane receptor protein involved in Fe transport